MTQLAKVRKAASRMNGQEQEYANLFLGQLDHGFEEIALRLADGSWYTPDFWVKAKDDVLEFHEVKGHWREAARVRIRVAAERYPQFRFKAFRKLPKALGGMWQVEHFGQPDAA
jgi:hypothetical protein